ARGGTGWGGLRSARRPSAPTARGWPVPTARPPRCGTPPRAGSAPPSGGTTEKSGRGPSHPPAGRWPPGAPTGPSHRATPPTAAPGETHAAPGGRGWGGWGVAFPHAGRALAVGGGDFEAHAGHVELWDLPPPGGSGTPALRHRFQGHRFPTRAVAFSPDGKLL